MLSDARFEASLPCSDLRQRGVQFEDYDFPGFDKATGIADVGGTRAAWFKDSEGNLLGLVEGP
jgi:hypothetical protein